MKRQICRILATAMLILLVSNIPVYWQNLLACPTKVAITAKNPQESECRSGKVNEIKPIKQNDDIFEPNVTDGTEDVEQNGKDISLVVTADGTTKDEAIKTALRSAIEQAYGTFVSANTTILNDELVKDEIVTIASGNIRSYQEISSFNIPDGRIQVTLQAVVAIDKLISYAQSKGASTEFAGAAFAMNMKMRELNKKNEMEALQNLLVQVKQLLPHCFDWELEILEPKLMTNRQFYDFVGFYPDEMKGSWGNMSSRMGDVSEDFSKKLKQEILNLVDNVEKFYLFSMNVVYTFNENGKKMFDLIRNTLNRLSLSDQEREYYRNVNLDYEPFCFSLFDDRSREYKVFCLKYLRNSQKDLIKWMYEFREMCYHEFANFKIVDNLGGESLFDGKKILAKSRNENDEDYYYENGLQHVIVIKGKGLFAPFVSMKTDGLGRIYGDLKLCVRPSSAWKLSFLMPKDDIMKYSQFTVERKY